MILLLRQQFYDIFFDIFRFDLRGIAFDDVSLGVDQKLGKVPLDLGGQKTAFLGLEVGVERVFTLAVD